MRNLAAFLLILASVPYASALAIGVSPGTADLGMVERGKSYLVDFYLISDTDRNIVVDLNVRGFGEEFLQYQGERRYGFNPMEASQESMDGWLEFLENPASVPAQKFLASVGSVPINANKKITFALRIPDDAEPGYHAAFIKAVPRLKTYRGGLGIGILTTSEFKLVFQVPGKAVRSGYIVGFTSRPVQGPFEMMGVVFKNNGTVTIKATAEPVIVYKNANDTFDAFVSRGVSGPVRPGQITEIPVFVKRDDLGLGVMDIYSRVSWMTGEENRTGKIAITGLVAAPQPAGGGEKKEDNFALLMLLIIIVLLIIAFRRRR